MIRKGVADAELGSKEYRLELSCIVQFFVAVFWNCGFMTFADRMNERRRTYKNTGDCDEVRRRREDEAVQIRKKEKEEQIAIRRRLVELSSDICGSTVCLNNLPISAGMPPAGLFSQCAICREYSPNIKGDDVVGPNECGRGMHCDSQDLVD